MTHSSRPSLPPLDCLIAALAAAKLGSLSAAATDLGVSHAAISRRIAGAESWAGLRLFDRHGRGVTATPDGLRLLTRVSQGIHIIDACAERARIVRGPIALRLATTPSFARLWLLPRLAQLEAGCGMRIEVLAHAVPANLQEQNIDVAIRYGRGGWRSGDEHRLFADESIMPFVQSALLTAQGSSIPARAVAALPLIHNADSTEWRSWFDAHGLKFRGKASDRVMGDYGLALAAAQAGLGVALCGEPPGPASGAPDPMRLVEELAARNPLAYYVIARPQPDNDPVGLLVANLLAAAREVTPVA